VCSKDINTSSTASREIEREGTKHRTSITTTTTMFPSTNPTINRILVMFGCTYPAMAIFRIGLGILVTIELMLRYSYLRPFYSNSDDDGTLPISLLMNKVDTLYKYVLCMPYAYCYGDPYQQQILLGLHIVISISITLGVYGSNTLCFISWYLYFTLTLRNTWLSYILDRYIHYLLFLSIFLPHYECYSIHSYLRSTGKRNKSTSHNPDINTSEMSSTAPKSETTQVASDWYISPATIVMKLFLFWIYLDAGYGKFLDQGWSYIANPLPALDTYARHTIIAQYITTIIGGTYGWRILTPLVVYIELGVVPLTLFGLFMYNAYTVYTGIVLITTLHIGIAATIRNATLLSFIAITPWSTFLPITIRDKGDMCHNEVTTIRWSGRRTTICTSLVLIPMIMGCIWFETMSRSCDQSVTHIWSTLLHNRWNVFVGAEEYVTWEIAPGLLADGTYVDVWKGSTVIDWRLPTIQSGGAPSTATSRPGRWRSFPYLADFAVDSDDYHALWGYLCKEWDRQHSPEQRLVQYNFFMLQSDVLPDMQFSATRKRLIVSYECSFAYSRKSQSKSAVLGGKMVHGKEPQDVADIPMVIDSVSSNEPGHIESIEYRIESSPEPDFPKTTTTSTHVQDEPERSRVSEHRIELIPDSDFPMVSPDATTVYTNTVQPEVSSIAPSDCRIELSPEPDFPKTSITSDTVVRQPELSTSDCRIELSPEPDFPKTSLLANVGNVQPELSKSDCRIELSPEPDFPKTSTMTDTVDGQPELRKLDYRIELSPEPDFPKTSLLANVGNVQPELSKSDCRIELSPEPDFPKTSILANVGDAQPELSTSDCRIELSPEPDFPKTSTITNSIMSEPGIGTIESEVRIELSP
jgi:hypothetical protein